MWFGKGVEVLFILLWSYFLLYIVSLWKGISFIFFCFCSNVLKLNTVKAQSRTACFLWLRQRTKKKNKNKNTDKNFVLHISLNWWSFPPQKSSTMFVQIFFLLFSTRRFMSISRGSVVRWILKLLPANQTNSSDIRFCPFFKSSEFKNSQQLRTETGLSILEFSFVSFWFAESSNISILWGSDWFRLTEERRLPLTI